MTPLPFIDLQAQRQRIGQKLEARMHAVLAHGQFIQGPEVTALEQQLAAFCGVAHVVSCANGTDALWLVLRALGVKAGDAVIVPGFTYAATAEAVALTGATPVFADIEEHSFNLCIRSTKEAITVAQEAGLKVRGVISVDLFGQLADYAALDEVLHADGLFLLCDAAQAFGAAQDGRMAGQYGVATSFSFFPSKPLGCYGDGGAIATDDAALAQQLRSLCLHGTQGVGQHVRLGCNSRLDTLQAAVLLEKLAVFEEELAARAQIAARYEALLGGRVRVPVLRAGARSSWAQYSILLPEGSGRETVRQVLAQQGIPTQVYYARTLAQQPAYAHYPAAALPVCERVAGQILSLPMHAYLTPEQQQRVAAALIGAL